MPACERMHATSSYFVIIERSKSLLAYIISVHSDHMHRSYKTPEFQQSDALVGVQMGVREETRLDRRSNQSGRSMRWIRYRVLHDIVLYSTVVGN
jgi:hypothetical protein